MSQFPKHNYMVLSHNPHVLSNCSVATAVQQGRDGFEDDDWISPKEKLKAISSNTCWSVSWGDPKDIASYYVMTAHSFTKLMEKVSEHDG